MGRPGSGAVGPTIALAGGSFADKLFFKPIDRDGFLALYRPLLAAIDPRLVLFAFDSGGDLAGFLFGLPDWAQGATPDTAILKTYASRKAGAGHLLAHAFHENARELGYAKVIHALMHVDNVSRDRSVQHEGAVFRRYTLFGRSDGLNIRPAFAPHRLRRIRTRIGGHRRARAADALRGAGDARAGALAAAWHRQGTRAQATGCCWRLPLDADLYAALAALWRIGAAAVLPEPALGLYGLRHAVDATAPRAMLTSGLFRLLPLDRAAVPTRTRDLG